MVPSSFSNWKCTRGWGPKVHISDGGVEMVWPWPHWLPGWGSLGPPRPPRSEPRAPRSDPRPNQDLPRATQDPLREAQEPQRAAQEPPRAAQDHPKTSQERPKSPQELPRGSWDLKNQDLSVGFSMCFENYTCAIKTTGKSMLVPQGLAKRAQEGPRAPQKRPRPAQDHPRPPQDRP